MPTLVRLALVLALLITASTGSALAQQTGAGDDAAAVPATPAEQPDSPGGGFVSRVKGYLTKDKEPRDETVDRVGFYPRIGGLTTGSGLALGAGYRTHLFNTPFYADVSGVVSTKRYLGLDGRLRLPSPAPRRLELWATAALRRFPQEDYFGLGEDSAIALRSNYTINSTDFGGEAIVHLTPWMQVGTDVGYFQPMIKAGTDSNYPTITEVFTDVTAPGLAEQPDYLHYGVFTAVDYRDARGNPRSGGFYRASLSNWDGREAGYDFRRFDGELNQYVPLGSPRHVLVGRVGASLVNNTTGDRVPFYVFPYVGGSNTVRSYREFRFREENAMYLTGEYRFGLMKYVQLVAFADAGKVARNWEDIVTLDDLKKGYGGGVRAGTSSRTFARLDVGTGGGEGRRIFLKFFPSF